VSNFHQLFSLLLATGWKIGWCFGPSHLIQPVILANQWVQYSVSTPTQHAVAEIIEAADAPYEGYSSYYDYVRNEYQQKRDYLAQALKDAHFIPIIPEGGYFIIADTSRHNDVPESYRLEPGPSGESPVSRDWAFARYVLIE